MKKHIVFCIAGIFATIHVMAADATCSRANLTRCLDSACAINISSNPSARCQYCGTTSAGTPKTSTMRSVTTGSTKYNITDKQLKSAPTDPGERYVWATRQCIEKMPECTPDDVSETYDSLIEQSCRAAGVTAQISSLTKSNKKTASACNSGITTCISDKCGTDFSQCENDSDFNRFFSECMVSNSGCETYSGDIKTTLMNERTRIVKAKSDSVSAIVNTYKTNRSNRVLDIRNGCANNSARDKCVASVCNNNMKHNCDEESEKSMAIYLCGFYDTACRTIK